MKRSAVAIALTEEDDVIFEIRSERISHQPGDICLPGGGLEKDETPVEAAVRELMEELRIDREQIGVLAPIEYIRDGNAGDSQLRMQSDGVQGFLSARGSRQNPAGTAFVFHYKQAGYS